MEKAGKGMLLTADGVYIGGVGEQKIQMLFVITEDEEAPALFAKAAQTILSGDHGTTSYESNKGANNYSRVQATNWSLIITMPNSELTEPFYNYLQAFY